MEDPKPLEGLKRSGKKQQKRRCNTHHSKPFMAEMELGSAA